MWFKNVICFRLPLQNMPTAEQLETALQKRPFFPCTGLQLSSAGWVPVLPQQADRMTWSNPACSMLMLKREEKVLPTSVVKERLAQKVGQIEKEELRRVGKKEQRTLKQDVIDDLLPRAFAKSRTIQGLLDRERGYLLIDAAQAKRAEEWLSVLREHLPVLPLSLFHTERSPASAMTEWLLSGPPTDFALDNDCELKDGNGAVIRCLRHDLTLPEIQQHVLQGKTVSQLGLVFQERVRFTLTESLQLKRIGFLDTVQQEASEEGEDPESLFVATASLMQQELSLLWQSLLLALGGAIEMN